MSRHREDTCRQHSGSAQTTVSKEDDTDKLRTYSSGMTAIESKGSRSERLRGWVRERGAEKQLPLAYDQPVGSTNEMRTKGRRGRVER